MEENSIGKSCYDRTAKDGYDMSLRIRRSTRARVSRRMRILADYVLNMKDMADLMNRVKEVYPEADGREKIELARQALRINQLMSEEGKKKE